MRIEIPHKITKRFIELAKLQGKVVVYRRLPMKKDLCVVHSFNREDLNSKDSGNDTIRV